MFFGSIEINNAFTYNKNRLYEVKINNEIMMVNATDYHQIPIIPFLVHFNTYNSTVYHYGDPYYIDGKGKYILNIKSYKCYASDYDITLKCDTDNETQRKKETKNTKYTNLYIRKDGKPEEVMYDGKMISDITPYIKEKGHYYIRISAKYKLVNFQISFTIWNKG